MTLHQEISNYPSTFIVPHFMAEESLYHLQFLQETLDGFFSQTDSAWNAVIIDDHSKCQEAHDYLRTIKEKFYPKIDVIFLDKNFGPGVCRNVGILWAKKRNSPIIHFNDADDISHSNRVEVVKELFLKDPSAGLIYSTFQVIDEDQNIISHDKISAPILEIIESHQSTPLEGDMAWIEMATKTGYTNKTSATSVLTTLAARCPFPPERASEDYHTWMRISAHGASYRYTPSIPILYRIPTYMKYQASRTRIGPKIFNQIKARVDADGFSKAIEISLSKGSLSLEEIPALKAKFYNRLALSMKRDNETALAEELLERSRNYLSESSFYNSVEDI